MSSLHIDITPSIWQSDGYANIARDVSRHFLSGGHAVEWQALGRRIRASDMDAPPSSLKRHIATALEKKRKEVDTARRFNVDAAPFSGKDVNIAFSPLSLTFMRPTRHSIVYLSDLAAITRPEWFETVDARVLSYAIESLYDPSISIVVPSASTARELWANLGIPRTRCHIVRPYLVARASVVRIRQPERRLLYVGAIDRQSNLPGLIEAFSASGLQQRDYQLIIAGAAGYGADAIRKQARRTGNVQLLERGEANAEALEQEYLRCCALVYTPYWDGSALPLLETMAAVHEPIPTLLSDSGAMTELQSTHFIYVDPCNRTAIARGLTDLAARAEASAKTRTTRSNAGEHEWLTNASDQFSRDVHLGKMSSLVDALLR